MAYTTSPSSTGQSTSGLGGKPSTDKTTAVSQALTPSYGVSSARGPSTVTAEEKIEEKKAADIAPIIFPSDLGGNYYISFNAFTHATERPAESQRTFTFKKSIFLPLPSNISDGYSAGYNSEDLYFAGNAAKEMTSNLFAENGGVVNGLSKLGDANYMANKLSQGIKSLTKDKVKNAAAAAAIQGITGLGGPIGAAARSSLQLTTNPFPVMIFQGTGFKPDFTFDWTLYPESYSEAQTIKTIIGFFRREMLPEKLEGNSAILKTPSIFEIKMVPDDYTRKFKRCVLKNMSVNYAPNGPSFIVSEGTGAGGVSEHIPSSITLSLTFGEIELWLADDYQPFEELQFAERPIF